MNILKQFKKKLIKLKCTTTAQCNFLLFNSFTLLFFAILSILASTYINFNIWHFLESLFYMVISIYFLLSVYTNKQRITASVENKKTSEVNHQLYFSIKEKEM